MNNPQTLQCPNCMCQARNIYCHKYTLLDFTSNKHISQDCLQIQDKSTNETTHPAPICVQIQNNSSNNPTPPESKWCDWAMGAFSHMGHDTPYQEQCISFRMKMVTCQHIGCSTKLHPLCHINWLKRHCYKPPSQHFCWQHSDCYQLWVCFKANKIPHSQNGCISGSDRAAG